MVSKFWLNEGSLAVPNVPSNQRPFHSLVLSDIELVSACRSWMLEHRNKDIGRSTLSIRALCLEDRINETQWLSKTPLEWLNADKRMQTLPSKKEELGDSLLVADANISRVTCPFNLEPIRPMPITWISSLRNPNPPPDSTISIRTLKAKVKNAFSSIVSVNKKHNFGEELIKSYDPLINYLKNSPHKTRYSAVVNALIDDIRLECLIYAYLRRRASYPKSRRGVIYKIISETEPPKVIEDASEREYDIPAFLNGEKARGYPSKILLKAFSEFVKTGRISGMKELQMPQELDDPDVETTVNILGPIGLITPTARVTSHFSACKNWIDDYEYPSLALTFGRFN